MVRRGKANCRLGMGFSAEGGWHVVTFEISPPVYIALWYRQLCGPLVAGSNCCLHRLHVRVWAAACRPADLAAASGPGGGASAAVLLDADALGAPPRLEGTACITGDP